jgi:hypothetical protein
MSARSCSLARSVFFIAVSQASQGVVNRNRTATYAQCLVQLCERGIRVLLNECVKLFHLGFIQRRRVVPAWQRFTAATLTVALEPPLKGRNINPITFRHLVLSALPGLIRRDGPLSNFSTGYSHG